MKPQALSGIMAFLSFSLPMPASGQGVAEADASLQSDIIQELNFARTRPQAYTEALKLYRSTFQGFDAYRVAPRNGRPMPAATRTFEGTRAVDEAIQFLDSQMPIAPFSADFKLTEAARRFAEEKARTGQMGHVSANGDTLSDRVDIDGTRRNANAETINYGANDAHQIVMQLIIDDGVPDRSHRAIVFDTSLTLVGIACRRSSRWLICVGEYSSAMPSRLRRPASDSR